MRTLAVNVAIIIAITSLLVLAISAQLAVGAPRETIEPGYTVTANPYLPIHTVEPAF
jgi:hypothetical protein